jgi:molybdopterin synthase catalytic subunit
MVLAHNGLVRATSKEGRPVRGMTLSYDTEKLERAVAEHKKRDGISDIRVWINRGELQVGDDIMRLLVAGRFRTDVLPVFESLLTMIKREIVREQEIE